MKLKKKKGLYKKFGEGSFSESYPTPRTQAPETNVSSHLRVPVVQSLGKRVRSGRCTRREGVGPVPIICEYVCLFTSGILHDRSRFPCVWSQSRLGPETDTGVGKTRGRVVDEQERKRRDPTEIHSRH